MIEHPGKTPLSLQLSLVGTLPASSHQSTSTASPQYSSRLTGVQSDECRDTSYLSENPTPKSPSPAVTAAIAPEHAASLHVVSRVEVLVLIFKQTAALVLGGIGIMIVGIGFSQAFILPRIRVCLFDANCSLPLGVGVGNALTLLQTFMHYWLQAGMLVASIGLLKLSAYQAWFILMRDGNTIGNLDLSLGAIRGSILDAGRLVFRKRGRWLSVYVLSQLGIAAAISLIVGLSIIREREARTFTYPTTIEFPDSSYVSNIDQGRAAAEVSAWAVLNDTSHRAPTYQGSLVIPDERNTSTNSRPGGPRIKGALSCAGFNNYSIILNGEITQYHMYVDLREYLTPPGAPLAVVMVGAGTAITQYIWVSNTTGRVPNATRTSDGMMNIALCTHDIYFVENSEGVNGVQEINPSIPFTPGCPAADPHICVSDAVNKAIINWWGGSDPHFLGVSCRGSVLGPLPLSGVFEEDNCPLTEALWSDTVTSMLDGLVQTGQKSGQNSTQTLIASVATVNAQRWWLQALIPSLTLILYVVGLVYTTVLSQGRNVLKELTLAEIIGAAQTEYVRVLLESGNLAKAVVQYEREAGFTSPVSPRMGKFCEGKRVPGI